MKKIGVWQFECGIVRLYNADVSDTLLRESGDVVSFLGYIEVEAPKKTVTKEVRGWRDPSQVDWVVTSVNERGNMVAIPPDAEDIRIVFNVKE